MAPTTNTSPNGGPQGLAWKVLPETGNLSAIPQKSPKIRLKLGPFYPFILLQ